MKEAGKNYSGILNFLKKKLKQAKKKQCVRMFSKELKHKNVYVTQTTVSKL